MFMPAEQIERIVDNTVAVLTTHGNRRAEWQGVIADALSLARQGGPPWQPEAEFFEAIQALLQSPDAPPAGTDLSADHPYAAAWAAIQSGVAEFGAGPGLSDEQLDFIVHRTAEVLTTDPDGRAEWRTALSGALSEARDLKRTDDAEFFEALLAMLDAPEGAEERAAGLPPDHNYAATLALIWAMVEAGGPSNAATTMETMRIVRDFLAADDWTTTRRVLEAHADVLLSPQVDELFASNLAACRARGEDEAARMLEQHLIILRACRQRGIAPVFDLLEAADAPDDMD